MYFRFDLDKKSFTMWEFIVRLLLRNRLAILIILLLGTIFMGYKASKVQLSYEMVKMLPGTDINSIRYDEFKKMFGEDGSVLFVGIQDSEIFKLQKFNALYDLTNKIKKVDGIEAVLSVTDIPTLVKDEKLSKIQFDTVVKSKPKTQHELDSLKNILYSLKFYRGLIFNPETNTYVIGVTLDKKKLNDASRLELIKKIISIVDEFSTKNKIQVHYSGLPYIRTVITLMLKSELKLFIVISLLIALLVIILFFRSFYVVLTSLIIVVTSVIWAVGTIVLFDFRVTILISVIPSLIIIIAIENCIYLVNKYHWEFKKHGNKILSISKVVTRIGFATFMTNITTATGFATFIFTSNTMLKQFGIISSLNVMIEYILSLILTTIIFSYLPPPKPKHIKHLERKSLNLILDKIKHLIEYHRPAIYTTGLVIILACVYGIFCMKTSGKIVDDIPENNPIAKDLKFFENQFGGVMPFEITIDTKKPKGVFADEAKTLYKIKRLQRVIKNDTSYSKYFSQPLSIVEALSFAYQAYKGGDPKYYILPPATELSKMNNYMPEKLNNKNAFHSFIDSTRRYTRVSLQVADLGTKQMKKTVNNLKSEIDSIFDPKEYDVSITGSSIVFSKGTEFLINNLWESIIIGILIISLLMAIIFSSLRMIVIAMTVNIIPLLITAAIMGYFNIPVKPSTIIVFSVALGISIDNAILFLSRYRHEIKKKKQSIRNAVMNAMSEAGISMIYTSIVLVLGFAIFMFSGFGGTKALGMLISITLSIALFFNIIVLPSLILTFEKIVTTKAFEEPIIEVFEEEENDESEASEHIQQS